MSEKLLETALKHKERTISDLIRFISTRAGNFSKYNLLLGAGCSITSGVRSANELSEMWLKELYVAKHPSDPIEEYTSEKARDYFKNDTQEGYWYNPNHEYSSLFEKRFDLPSQRRSFVEEEVGGKFPSIGYAYLIRLIEQNYFNTIFTTNFDDLLNEAFHLFTDCEYTDDKNRDLMRPIVCAHDSSVKSIAVTSIRPKIIKLHGDYLFDDIKSTERETESLEENIRNKFVEFCKDFGLIVVGYSGCDRSIMDVLNMLLKNDDYLKNGLYWCIRRGDVPAEELRKLLWKDRVYFVYIDGFDELFAELYKSTSQKNDSPLPILLPNKNALIMERMAKNPFLQKSESQIIKDEIQKINNEVRRNTFFNSMKEVLFPDGKDEDFQGYSFEETSKLLEIDKLTEEKKNVEALEKTKTFLAEPNLTNEFKEKLLRNGARISKRLEKWDEAIKYCDELIKTNANAVAPYFFKNKFLLKLTDKIENMRKCISYNTYSYECYEKLTNYEYNLLSNTYDDRENLQMLLLDDLKKGIEMNPFFQNDCFRTKFSLLTTYRAALQKDWKEVCEKEILEPAQKQNPDHPLCYFYRHNLIDIDKISEEEKKQKYEDMWNELHEKIQTKFEQYIDSMIALLDEKIVCQEKINFIYQQFENNQNRLCKNTRFQRTKAKFLATYCGEISKAQDIISNIPNDKITFEDLQLLRMYGELIGNCTLAQEIMQKSREDFFIAQQYEIDHMLAEMNKEYEKSLQAIDKMDQYASCPYDHFTNRIYTLLELERYDEAYIRSNDMMKAVSNPNSRQSCDIINYEISRIGKDKKVRTEELVNLVKSAENTHIKVAANLLLGKISDANSMIKNDISYNFDSLHFYENTLVFQKYGDAKTREILTEAHRKIK